jgi:hypothetical protein
VGGAGGVKIPFTITHPAAILARSAALKPGVTPAPGATTSGIGVLGGVVTGSRGLSGGSATTSVTGGFGGVVIGSRGLSGGCTTGGGVTTGGVTAGGINGGINGGTVGPGIAGPAGGVGLNTTSATPPGPAGIVVSYKPVPGLNTVVPPVPGTDVVGTVVVGMLGAGAGVTGAGAGVTGAGPRGGNGSVTTGG